VAVPGRPEDDPNIRVRSTVTVLAQLWVLRNHFR